MGDADALLRSVPLAVLLGLIPAVIAYRKGRSFLGWWLGGALMFIVALPWALLLRPDTEALEERERRAGASERCPHCSQRIRPAAAVCPRCGREIWPVADPDDTDDTGEPVAATVQATCTHCRTVADLDEAEVARREFICPFCGEAVPLQFG